MKRKLRLITLNLWHGLDHSSPRVMLPIESMAESRARRDLALVGLKKLLDSPNDPNHLNIICLQECNPVQKTSKQFAKALGLSAAVGEANVGIRLGELSYPPFLQEGLVTLWSQELKSPRAQRITLSGRAPEINLRFGRVKLPFTIQLSERRVAHILTGLWGATRIAVINAHMHHGAPEGPKNKRRHDELELLFESVQDELRSSDLFFLAGDFNCERHHAEFEFLRSQGFHEISIATDGAPLITWEPKINPICQKTSGINDMNLAQNAWDQSPHQFDHIFLRCKDSRERIPDNFKATSQLVFDNKNESVVSDHYGICTDLEWE